MTERFIRNYRMPETTWECAECGLKITGPSEIVWAERIKHEFNHELIKREKKR